MSALIDTTTGRAGIAYVGETPWHGMGTQMPDNADMDQWRINAGLNWTAVKAPVEFITPTGTGQVDGKSVLYRDDTEAGLSVVSNSYKIVQPGEVMEFYRELCDKYDFQMETAGSLKGGRVIWALAQTGQDFRLHGTDVVNGYVLMSTSFDSSMATSIRATSIRVVCNNTLQIAGNDKAQFSLSHRSQFNPAQARVAIGLDEWEHFKDAAGQMSETGMSPKQSIEFFMRVYHDITADMTITDKQEKSAERTVRRLIETLTNAPGANLPSAKNTVWGAVNAVTRDVDFQRRSKNQDTRLLSAWYGQGNMIKQKAWDAAKELIAA